VSTIFWMKCDGVRSMMRSIGYLLGWVLLLAMTKGPAA
jgi:hypothetical protein